MIMIEPGLPAQMREPVVGHVAAEAGELAEIDVVDVHEVLPSGDQPATGMDPYHGSLPDAESSARMLYAPRRERSGGGNLSREIPEGTQGAVSVVPAEVRESSDIQGMGRYPWYVLALLFAVYLSNHIDRQILAILIEPTKREFGASDTMMGLLTGPAFAVFFALAGLPIARWADRGTRRTIIAISAALWSALTALSGLAASYAQLALLRVGVGVGEAGCSPPSHSLIADYFPAERRGRALGAYMAGGTAGSAFGLLMGGLLYSAFGWRMSFVAVGLPGLLLAVLVWLTVREPERGRWDRGASAEPMPVREALAFLWQQRSYVHAQLGGALHAIATYGVNVWLVAFFMRVHGMELATATTMLGIATIFIGIPGMFLGGWLSDQLAPRDPRWYLWLPTVAAIAAVPFSVMFLFASSPLLAVLCYLPHSVLNSTYSGPVSAMTQAVVRVRARALAVAIHLLCVNLLGLGLGPLIIGALNDSLRGTYGDLAIRYTMLVAVAANALACVFYVLGARTVRQEIARARRD
jgi:MFS family permease